MRVKKCRFCGGAPNAKELKHGWVFACGIQVNRKCLPNTYAFIGDTVEEAAKKWDKANG